MSRNSFSERGTSATVRRTRTSTTFGGAAASLAGSSPGCTISTKWPSGSRTMIMRAGGALAPIGTLAGAPVTLMIGVPWAARRASTLSMSRTMTRNVNAPGSCMRRASGLPPASVISTISTPPIVAGTRAMTQRILASGRPNMARSAGFAAASPGGPCTSRPKPSR